MALSKIKKGDEVIVIAGKSKGHRGEVTRVLKEEGKVIVTGANMAKKHQKPNPQVGEPGGIIEKEMPLDMSNVMLFDGEKGSRVGIRVTEDGTRERFFKSNGNAVD